MDIKLRARLSAYSKLESLQDITSNNSNIPNPDVTAEGNVLGVNGVGNYTLFPTVKDEDIDTLFSDVVSIETVKKEEIDTLFGEKIDNDSSTETEVETPTEPVDPPDPPDASDNNSDESSSPSDTEDSSDIWGVVSKESIDSLF